jgi:hypothetical protein
MISRFFKKKKAKAPEKPKKNTSEKPHRSESQSSVQPQKLITAEGWKRLMMHKTAKK